MKREDIPRRGCEDFKKRAGMSDVHMPTLFKQKKVNTASTCYAQIQRTGQYLEAKLNQTVNLIVGILAQWRNRHILLPSSTSSNLNYNSKSHCTSQAIITSPILVAAFQAFHVSHIHHHRLAATSKLSFLRSSSVIPSALFVEINLDFVTVFPNIERYF